MAYSKLCVLGWLIASLAVLMSGVLLKLCIRSYEKYAN